MKRSMYIIPTEPISTAQFASPSHSNTNITAIKISEKNPKYCLNLFTSIYEAC
jgi:hypothetical protein